MNISPHKLGVDVVDARDVKGPNPVSYCVFCNGVVETTELPMLVLRKHDTHHSDVWCIAHQACAHTAKTVSESN